MIEITPQIARDYHRIMARHYRATIIHKATAKEMKSIAWVLDLMGVDGKQFLDHFAITAGRRIYANWKPGVGSPKQLAYQCRVITHEMRHVSQGKGNIGRFMALYAALPSFRARKELDAFRCDLEMHFAIHGKPMSVAKLTKHLKEYRIGFWNRRMIRRKLKEYNVGVAKGLVRQSHCKYGIKILRRLAASIKTT